MVDVDCRVNVVAPQFAPATSNVLPIVVAPLTLIVPKKPVLPVIVVVPNTLSVLPKLVAPDTLNVPKKPELPVIFVEPNTLSILPKLTAPLITAAPSIEAVLLNLAAPLTLNVLCKCVAPTIVVVPPTNKVPPIVALLTDIFPVITAGTFVRLAPSPKKDEAHTFALAA